jgi:hypothetical protein
MDRLLLSIEVDRCTATRKPRHRHLILADTKQALLCFMAYESLQNPRRMLMNR